MGCEPGQDIRCGSVAQRDRRRTSVPNYIRQKAIVRKTFSMVHHPGTAAYISQDDDGYRAERVLVAWLEKFPNTPCQPKNGETGDNAGYEFPIGCRGRHFESRNQTSEWLPAAVQFGHRMHVAEHFTNRAESDRG